MAVISRGITLAYRLLSESADLGGTFEGLTNLQEIPELGGDTESIEITTLADAAHKYTDGIKNYGDSLAFKFLYEKQQFTDLQNRAQDAGGVEWKVTLPDDTTCTFQGLGFVKLDGVGVNAALTYTLSIKPNTEMIWE